MSTQETSPISTLIEDLGIEVATNDETSNEDEDLNLSDSDKEQTTDSTQTDDTTVEDTTEVETSDDDDTEGSELLTRLSELEKKQEIADKRIVDKDKYINELKQQLEGTKREEVVEETETEDFWDNPEGKFDEVNNQLRIANLRLDEFSYAADKPDYFQVVNGNKLKEEFAKDSEFMNEFNNSARPYEVAYEYMKKQQSKQKTSEEETRAKIEKEIMAKYGLDKKAKKTPPSINNLGGKSSDKKELPEDGFASVFGTGF